MYENGLKKLNWIKLPNTPLDIDSSYYMYHVQVKDRDKFAKYLRKKEIYTTFRYYPLHRVNFYQNKKRLPNTEYAANHTLCLPLHQSLTNKEVNYVIDIIKKWKH